MDWTTDAMTLWTNVEQSIEALVWWMFDTMRNYS